MIKADDCNDRISLLQPNPPFKDNFVYPVVLNLISQVFHLLTLQQVVRPCDVEIETLNSLIQT